MEIVNVEKSVVFIAFDFLILKRGFLGRHIQIHSERGRRIGWRYQLTNESLPSTESYLCQSDTLKYIEIYSERGTH